MASSDAITEKLKGFLQYIFQADHFLLLGSGLLAGGPGTMLNTWVQIPYAIVSICCGLICLGIGVLIKQNVTRGWFALGITLIAVLVPLGGFTAYSSLTTSPAENTISLYELNRDPLGAPGNWKSTSPDPIPISKARQLESDIPKNYYNNGFYRLRPCVHHATKGLKLVDVHVTLRIASQLNIQVIDHQHIWNHITRDGYEEYTAVIPEVGYRSIKATPGWFEFNRSGHESFPIVYRIEGKDELAREVTLADTTITLHGLESR